MTFYDTLNQICLRKGIDITPFVTSLGMSAGAINSWRNGSEPRNSTKKKIADALGVDVSIFSATPAVEYIPADPAKVAEERATLERQRDENWENIRNAANAWHDIKKPPVRTDGEAELYYQKLQKADKATQDIIKALLDKEVPD